MKLNDPFVITISREVGSGGGTVGRKLAEKLGVNYSDKHLIKELEEKFNLTRESIEHLKKKKKNWFTDIFEQATPANKSSIKVGGYTFSREYKEAVTVQDIFDAEKEILNAFADEGSCVIAGRSAFFVLKDRPNKVDIFITASKEHRIERIMAKHGQGPRQLCAALHRAQPLRHAQLRHHPRYGLPVRGRSCREDSYLHRQITPRFAFIATRKTDC